MQGVSPNVGSDNYSVKHRPLPLLLFLPLLLLLPALGDLGPSYWQQMTVKPAIRFSNSTQFTEAVGRVGSSISQAKVPSIWNEWHVGLHHPIQETSLLIGHAKQLTTSLILMALYCVLFHRWSTAWPIPYQWRCWWFLVFLFINITAIIMFEYVSSCTCMKGFLGLNSHKWNAWFERCEHFKLQSMALLLVWSK